MREGVRPRDPERAAALELVHRLRDVALRLDLAIGEFAKTTGLHNTDVRALVRLLDAERAGVEATPTWLAQQLGMTSQATTAVIHRLEAAGHVERRRSRTDGRSSRLQVSDSAIALGWQFFGPLLDQLVATTSTFTKDDQATITKYLTALTEAID
ncbi:MarR family winged helix-turn-helix transcriptional regulator [Kribbella solani]|uniref:DNA-binding MarR family transcriptional regulator n=1 Tax=Kribbella solani TaxID=236067 RepID=A0A841DR03_9ACTN|nr:MarR family transcriptional regulator [Kribbella solani]MBB5979130.1 DNA-binding MarR family transcriptional regulator [Kribbella solani]